MPDYISVGILNAKTIVQNRHRYTTWYVDFLLNISFRTCVKYILARAHVSALTLGWDFQE